MLKFYKTQTQDLNVFFFSYWRRRERESHFCFYFFYWFFAFKSQNDNWTIYHSFIVNNMIIWIYLMFMINLSDMQKRRIDEKRSFTLNWNEEKRIFCNFSVIFFFFFLIRWQWVYLRKWFKNWTNNNVTNE